MLLFHPGNPRSHDGIIRNIVAAVANFPHVAGAESSVPKARSSKCQGGLEDLQGIEVTLWTHVKTGWWFGTFFIFPYIGNNHPN